MGAWIETQITMEIKTRKWVAPHVGAWIETAIGYEDGTIFVSHPMWVRGLKLVSSLTLSSALLVAPHVGAWIETR